MQVLFSVKTFDVEFLPDLYVLRPPEAKKVVFKNWCVLEICTDRIFQARTCNLGPALKKI